MIARALTSILVLEDGNLRVRMAEQKDGQHLVL